MQKLREAADSADLEVKVEPMQGVLMIWWFPKVEKTFLDDVVQHMGAVPEGELEATEEQLFVGGVTNLNELYEYFNTVAAVKQSSIWINEAQQLGGTKHLKIRWEPRDCDSSNEHPEEAAENEQTYLERIFDEMGEAERGTTRANKARMMQSVDVENMLELMKFFETFGQLHEKELRIIHSGMNAEAVISWRPLSEKTTVWPLGDGEK
jgi:hypothetical protein